jgi:K+:H+ antiporter
VNTLETVALLVLDLAVILAAAKVAGIAFERIGQPAVIGEIIAGFLLGPSLLGALPGDLSGALFPHDVQPALKTIGQIGLALFMFTVGLDFRVGMLRRRGPTAAAISIGSIVVPLCLGLVLAVYLYDAHDIVDGAKVPFVPFALFIGVSMSITAFPVLARILVSLRLTATVIGTIVLAAAAIDDVLGWSLLAIALATASADAAWSGPVTVVGAALYAGLLLFGVRPRVKASIERVNHRFETGAGLLLGGLVLIGLAASAAFTEAIGVHFVFGSFLFGAAISREAAAGAFDWIYRRIQPLGRVLLPVFFVTPGLALELGDLGSGAIGELALILTVACTGKFAGAAGAAVLRGTSVREAMAIGTLMNTRGLMELVVLVIGLDAGILDERLFAVLVLMALVTTVMTVPVLRRLGPRNLLEPEVGRTAQRAR